MVVWGAGWDGWVGWQGSLSARLPPGPACAAGAAAAAAAPCMPRLPCACQHDRPTAPRPPTCLPCLPRPPCSAPTSAQVREEDELGAKPKRRGKVMSDYELWEIAQLIKSGGFCFPLLRL